MSNTVKLNNCPKCGAPIPADAPQGLCPKCVLLGAASATEHGHAPTATAEIPSIARIAAGFPQLEIIELIGRGGMGFVFKARQPHLDRFVALKLLPDQLARDPRFAERFGREGRVLAKLNHPNIVSVYDFGNTEHFYFLLMEYVDGVNLRQAMQAGRFSPGEALAIVPKICEALQYAHSQGILHRDIKPENILLDARGQVKIADFGIAKLVGDEKPDVTLTATGAALGTLHYMAPEQLEKPSEVDHRADIYSLGVVFYEMLTGELPIGRFAAPSSKTPVGANVDEVVFRTLEKDRERRYQSVGEMKTQVEHLSEAGIAPPAPASAGDFGSQDTARVAPAVPHWLKPVAVLFLVLGATALPPTLMSLGTSRFVLNLFMLLALTGVALLTRNRSCRRAALAVNTVGLLMPWLSALNVSSAMEGGALSLAWRPPLGGIPANAGLAASFALLEASAFAAGLWVLLRRDVKALFEGTPAVAAAPQDGPTVAEASAIKRPAQALLAVGILNWIGSIVVMLVLVYAGVGREFPLSPQELGFIALLMIAFSSAILFAALKMMALRAYPLAVLGSVLAMFTTPGNIVGLPVGLWALVTLRQPKVRAAFRRTNGTAPELSHGMSAAILTCVLVGGVILSAWQWSKNQAAVTPTAAAGADPTVGTNQPSADIAPVIQFTFTTVELREEEGYRWLAMDFVQQTRGGCERTLRYDSSVPGFKVQTRTTSFRTDGKVGFEPVLHQRIAWKLPDALAQDEAQALRELVGQERIGKPIVLGPGEEYPLFKTVVPSGGSLVAAIGVKLQDPAGMIAAQLEHLLKRERELLTQFTPDHRLVKEVREKIANVERELKRSRGSSPSEGTQRDPAPPPSNAASAERWAPNVAPGEKPKPYEILQEASRLASQGLYEEALQRHIWYHHHALEFQPSQAGVRLSFALTQWMDLARRYPKAKDALFEIRDRCVDEFSGSGSRHLLTEISFINKALNEDYATVALFKSVQERDAKLARQCYQFVEDLLVETGEYALCASFIPDAQERFAQIRTRRERMLEAARDTKAAPALLRQEAQRVFIKETRALVEILVGVGRKGEAEEIRDLALSIVDERELQAAVDDAETRVKSMRARLEPK